MREGLLDGEELDVRSFRTLDVGTVDMKSEVEYAFSKAEPLICFDGWKMAKKVKNI